MITGLLAFTAPASRLDSILASSSCAGEHASPDRVARRPSRNSLKSTPLPIEFDCASVKQKLACQSRRADDFGEIADNKRTGRIGKGL